MNRNQSAGTAKVLLGKVESAAGEELGDPLIRARGEVLQVEGHVQEAAGSVQETIGEVADRARAAVSKASDAYGRVAGAARSIVRTVEDKPFMSVGVSMGVGLLLGLLMAARQPETIYVKPRG